MSEVRSLSPGPALSFVAGAKTSFRFALPMAFWSRRTLVLGLLGGALPLMAVVFLTVKSIPAAEIRTPGYIFFSNAFQFILYYVLLTALAMGTAVIAEEIDGRTLTYLTTRPVPKTALLLGKAAAAWTTGAVLIGMTVIAGYTVFTLGDGLLFSGGADSFLINLPTLGVDLLLTLGALAVYAAVFTFIGARFGRPMLWGIALAFGWESWVAFVPGLTRKLTAMHYIQSLSPHASGRNAAVALLQQGAGRFESVVALGVILAAFALLAGWTFSRREYEFDLSKR